MTAVAIPGWLANVLFLGACWIFLLAVVASIALRYWREREAVRAARVEEVMESLTSDITGLHEQDAC
jgi:hypothetical protein